MGRRHGGGPEPSAVPGTEEELGLLPGDLWGDSDWVDSQGSSLLGPSLSCLTGCHGHISPLLHLQSGDKHQLLGPHLWEEDRLTVWEDPKKEALFSQSSDGGGWGRQPRGSVSSSEGFRRSRMGAERGGEKNTVCL